jgi:hypothetical protein
MAPKAATSHPLDFIHFDQHSEQKSSATSLRSSWRSKLHTLVRWRSSVLPNNTTNSKRVLRRFKPLADESSSTRRVEEEQGAKKKVSFSKVEIREHVRIVGDHPACRDGLSLSIGWKHSVLVTVMDVDLFESLQSRAGKRRGPAKRLDAYERSYILRRLGGYGDEELKSIYTQTVPRAA